MTRDDANFLAAADRAAVAGYWRSLHTHTLTVTLSADEYDELTGSFLRAVRLATAAHLEQSRGGR